MLMAELERAEHGASGYVTDWLARASKAPRDPAWVADGIVSDHWLPASPVTGKLDAFTWQRPIEHLNSAADPEEAVFAPLPQLTAPPIVADAEPAVLPSEPEPRSGSEPPEPDTFATDEPALGSIRQ